MQYINFSQPYKVVNAGLLVPDYRSNEFSSLSKISKIEGLKIGVAFTDTYLIETIKAVFDPAEIEIIGDDEDFVLDEILDVDCIVTSVEIGSALSLLYPDFNVVIPEGLNIRQIISFGLKANEHEWASYINNWLYLIKESRDFHKLYDCWIQGMESEGEKKNWCVIRNVLQWVE